jgi:cytochrome b6-f complex iron-sulfur subunit
MADEQELSIEEILAAARAASGDNSDAAPDEESVEQAAPVEEAAAEPPAPSTPAAEMSVEEMLAAARGGGDAAAEEPAAADDEPADEPAKAAPAAKSADGMSVEEMLAAARGGAAEGESKPAATPAKKKPAAASAKEKPAAVAAAEPAEPAGPRDTSSVLAPRKGQRAGPLSHEQARDAGQPVEPLKGPQAAAKKPAAPPMPVKPAYASPAGAVVEQENRRGFFAMLSGALFGSSLAIGFTTLAATHLLWLLGLARFMFPNVLTEPPTMFKVGFPDEFAPGQVATKFKAQFGIWLVRFEYDGEAQIYALKSVCTHLGCTPNWLEGEQKFKCPCHGSGFYKDGINFEGPAPRPLERYAIRLADDGQLEIDKSRKFNEELGQWSDPASFVSV